MATCPKCGKRCSKHMPTCRSCEAKRVAEYTAKANATIATGKCPQCGRPLRRNLALQGWWQCEQYGADTHRADASAPACNFQTFGD